MDFDLEVKKQTSSRRLHYLGDPDVPAPTTDLLKRSESTRSVMGSSPISFRLSQEDLLLKPGEIPAVQDRFQALLKRRLLIEAQLKPPIFPWEDEDTEYEIEPREEVASYPVLAAASVWMAQIRKMSLPVNLPESVLTQLMDQCQAVVCSSFKEGAKIVKAVDSLFPGQGSLLNDIAGYVMVSPARSPIALQKDDVEAPLPPSYDCAIDTQKMALSLMAAREIMSALTLSVSPEQPQFEREWLTELGGFTLRATYDCKAEVRLRIDAEFPCGGSLLFHGQEFRSTAERDDAGRLSLEVRDLTPGAVYPLEVRLGEQDSLTFAISPQGKE
jgi:hypothetical protein